MADHFTHIYRPLNFERVNTFENKSHQIKGDTNLYLSGFWGPITIKYWYISSLGMILNNSYLLALAAAMFQRTRRLHRWSFNWIVVKGFIACSTLTTEISGI